MSYVCTLIDSWSSIVHIAKEIFQTFLTYQLRAWTICDWRAWMSSLVQTHTSEIQRRNSRLDIIVHIYLLMCILLLFELSKFYVHGKTWTFCPISSNSIVFECGKWQGITQCYPLIISSRHWSRSDIWLNNYEKVIYMDMEKKRHCTWHTNKPW